MPAPSQTKTRRVTQWTAASGARRVQDALAAEEPLEIQVDTHPIAITMRTPGHDEELAAGFLLSEGLIHQRSDVAKLVPHPRNRWGNTLNVFLGPEVTLDLARLTRHVFASSSCGLCGKSSIRSVHQHFPRIASQLTVPARTLLSLPAALLENQVTFSQTGGLHAAAIFDARGRLVVTREDVGRHNAVDKVLGYGFLNGLLPFQRHILMVSGRASFEILQKALAARIPIIAAVSAPSSLAAEFASASGQTLVGFLRPDRLNIYAHPQRIRFR